MMNLWPASELSKLARLSIEDLPKRVEAVRLIKFEADKTLMRVGELMLLMQKLGADVWMNYEQTTEGTGDISIGMRWTDAAPVEIHTGFQFPQIDLGALAPVPGQDNFQGASRSEL